MANNNYFHRKLPETATFSFVQGFRQQRRICSESHVSARVVDALTRLLSDVHRCVRCFPAGFMLFHFPTYRLWHKCWLQHFFPHDTLCLRHKCLQLYCLFCLRPAVVRLSWSPHIRDLRLFAEHMLRGSEQFANCGVINKTNTLCKDTDINHGAAG